MIDLLGLPLEQAIKLLEEKGYRVETVETRSRKGVDGDSLRVVRITDKPGDIPTVELVYSEFKTEVCSEVSADSACIQ